MKIVIKIPEDTYKMACSGYPSKEGLVELFSAIESGTPLPKGHGDLIDINNINEITLADSLYIMSHEKGDEVDWYIDSPIIIEADKG